MFGGNTEAANGNDDDDENGNGPSTVVPPSPAVDGMYLRTRIVEQCGGLRTGFLYKLAWCLRRFP